MPFSRPMDFSRLNEADVRAEVIDPLLRALGYQAGTEDNIAREGALRYERAFLGRKKPTDPILRGRPDYVIEVGTFGRWVLETKSGTAELSVDDFEQAQSYALHPNVAATLLVVTNGKEFLVFRSTAKDFNDRLFEFSYASGPTLWLQIKALLSPAGFRRAVPQIRFDAREPVADGHSSELRFGPAAARPRAARSSIPLPEAGMRSLANVQTPLRGAVCQRQEDGRLGFSISMGAATEFTEQLLKKKGLENIILLSDAPLVPTAPEDPVLFSGAFNFDVEAGETLLDLTTWNLVAMPFALQSYSRIDVSGRLDGERLVGTYSLRMYFRASSIDLNFEAEQVGDFDLPLLT